MALKKILIVGLLIASGISCVEPFNIRSLNFDSAVVVEGRLTDAQEVHFVKLSYTRPIDDDENVPLANAEVWVEDSEGGRIDFNESEPGLYKTEEDVAGVPGKRYQLFFMTSEGRHYQSGQQELIASPPIDSIYNRYAEKASSTSAEVSKGIQFFIDTHDETNRAKYFKYEWEETYEVRAPYPSLYEFFSDPDTAVARTEDVSSCYVSGKSMAVNVATTASLTENRLSEIPLRYLTSETDHLRYAYSILAKQYVISAEAYSFYNDILENNTDNGSLFEKQLGAVVGNVTSVEDPEETVLGFFEVSGVSEKRVFVKFEELDPRFPWPDQQYPCPSPHSISTTDSLDFYVRQKGYGIVSAEYCYTIHCNREFNATLAPKYCTDCRFRGPATKPDFWIY